MIALALSLSDNLHFCLRVRLRTCILTIVVLRLRAVQERPSEQIRSGVCVCVRAYVRMTVRDSVRAELQYSHSPAKYCAQLLSIISPALGTRTQPIFVLSDLTQFTECSWPINLVNRRQLTVACMDNKIT